jgi:acyl-coenzyme A thioesterase PaaI-like protein
MHPRDLPPPPGFGPLARRSPLTNPWEPIFSRDTERAVVLGLYARAVHTNSRGFVHGGLIGALCDAGMGYSCAKAVMQPGLVTVSLSLDYLSTAHEGQWLEFDTVFVKPGRTLCFAQAFVTADGQPCARANAVFRVVGEVRRTAA